MARKTFKPKKAQAERYVYAEFMAALLRVDFQASKLIESRTGQGALTLEYDEPAQQKVRR